VIKDLQLDLSSLATVESRAQGAGCCFAVPCSIFAGGINSSNRLGGRVGALSQQASILAADTGARRDLIGPKFLAVASRAAFL
jgi:hypothetical protein